MCNRTLVITLQDDCVTGWKFLQIPPTIEKAISSLAYQEGMKRVITERVVAMQGCCTSDLILMIMGQANTGKSTLAQYTVNSLLNQ